MAIPAGIDGNAPVIARHEIDINAPLETVWRLQSDITAARLDGPFEPGNSFTWTSYGFTVTSTIYAVAERARTLWGGPAGGIMGAHAWVYTQTPTGGPRGAAAVRGRAGHRPGDREPHARAGPAQPLWCPDGPACGHPPPAPARRDRRHPRHQGPPPYAPTYLRYLYCRFSPRHGHFQAWSRRASQISATL